MSLYINLQFQIISMIFIVMVLALFCGRRKLNITRERVFFSLIIACLVNCVLDLISVLGMYSILYMPERLVSMFRRLYLISCVAVGLCLLMYTLAEVYQMAIFNPLRRKLYLLIVILASFLMVRLPLGGFYEGERRFGPAVMVALFSNLIYLIICFLYAALKGSGIAVERRNAIFLATFLMTGCGFLQLRYPALRFISFAEALVLTYMYMVLESPDVYVDKTFDTFNKDAFHMYLENRCSEERPVSLMYISVDEISNMNRIAGTVISSELMRMAADYLKTCQPGRLFALDGGAFVLSFENDAHFFDHASRIRDRFAQPFNIKNMNQNSLVEFEIRISMVVYGAMRMPEGVRSDEIIETIKYFSSKLSGGRSNYLCIDRRQLWEMEAAWHVNNEIAGAVKEDRVDVFFQPIFSVYENSCNEIEALIRVRDRRNIYFDNSLILPAAENSGEITPLGYAVFRRICEFARDNDIKKAGISKIAVNLSTVQCQQRNLAENLIGIMEEYGVSASVFRFEISENTAEYMTQNLRRNMNNLMAQGASFVIDDFGGSRIDPDKVTQISRNYIKLGENVIRRYFNGDMTKQSMRVLCRMLLQLKMTVAAVGVEDQRQYAELKNLGITHMQGNAFYRPMPPDQVMQILEREKAVMLGKEEQFERAI